MEVFITGVKVSEYGKICMKRLTKIRQTGAKKVGYDFVIF